MKFHIELTEAHGVPDAILELAGMIRDDTDSTLRERQLAWMVVELSAAVNRLVVQLNCGTAVVVVEEPTFRSGD